MEVNICKSHVSHNGLVSRICKEFLELNKKISQFLKQRFLTDTGPLNYIQIAKKHIKTCLAIEMRCPKATRSPFTPTKITKIKKTVLVAQGIKDMALSLLWLGSLLRLGFDPWPWNFCMS